MGLSDVAKKATTTQPLKQNEVPKEAPSTALSVPSASAAGLLAVISAADSGQGLQFPLLMVAGGAQGGTMSPPEIANKMPQGKMPIEGVFVGLRTDLSAWPTGYDDRDPNAEQQPCWSVAVAAHDQANALVLQDACKQYQFTGKDKKAAFDHAASGVGHIKPTLQVMVWSKALGDLIVVQSPAAYESWVEGLRGILRLADPATGALAQFPMSMRVTSLPRSSKSGFSWLVHVFNVDVAPNAAGVEMMTAFKAWRAGLPEEKVKQVNDWLSASDRPMTQAIQEALVKAKGIK
jgi:hypothetical protein